MKIIVYGASGHGKVIIDAMKALNTPPALLWDDGAKPDQICMGYPVLLPNFSLLQEDYSIVISIGNNSIRKKIVNKIGPGVQFAKIIGPHAYISSQSYIGAGTMILTRAIIHIDTHIGDHCIINTASVVEHDCEIDNYVHISPGSIICGGCSIGEGTHIGAGAVVIPGIKIGKWCTIGAGAVIIRDVPDGSTVVGNPGRIIKTNLF